MQNAQLERNSQKPLEKIVKSLINKYELRPKAIRITEDAVNIVINNTEYAMSVNVNYVSFGWNRPFMVEPTIREYESIKEALVDLERCFQYHRFILFS